MMEDPNQKEKPPLGLMPRKIHKQKRMIEIVDAIQRYLHADKILPHEWIDELYDLSDFEYED